MQSLKEEGEKKKEDYLSSHVQFMCHVSKIQRFRDDTHTSLFSTEGHFCISVACVRYKPSICCCSVVFGIDLCVVGSGCLPEGHWLPHPSHGR